MDFSRTDHARVAEASGVRSWSVETPEEFSPALAATLEAGEPSLGDLVCQLLHGARPRSVGWVAQTAPGYCAFGRHHVGVLLWDTSKRKAGNRHV